MSEDKYVLEVSQEAYDDLINIQNYTNQTYNELQWGEYGYKLDAALSQILQYPH